MTVNRFSRNVIHQTFKFIENPTKPISTAIRLIKDPAKIMIKLFKGKKTRKLASLAGKFRSFVKKISPVRSESKKLHSRGRKQNLAQMAPLKSKLRG